MLETIHVKRHDGATSRVLIGDALAQLDDLLPSGRRVVVITDRNLRRAYPALTERWECVEVGLGEKRKTLATAEHIYRKLLEMNTDREMFILGVGGGIVTDITGFVASTWLRGVRFGFVATSLLAQVDASVGGKNGVNLHRYKNMVGMFNQPEFVLCDTGMLATLPEREFRAGLAEVIKSGIIADPALFDLFGGNAHGEMTWTSALTEIKREDGNADGGRSGLDGQLLTQAITRAVRVKANIVDQDERETGERRKLNLGHTFGHAVEKLSRRYVHGEAVAIGMAIIADLSARLGECDQAVADRVEQAIKKTGLPLESCMSLEKLLAAVRLDKKRDTDAINLILIRNIGDCIVRRMTFAELEALMIGR